MMAKTYLTPAAAVLFFVAAFTLIVLYTISLPSADNTIALCPAGQHAEYIDSGRDVNGQIVVAIGCMKNGTHL